MTEIGKRIKEIRIKRGLSQEDLAESAKINLRTIQRIENNETTPRGKTLKLIFDVLEIELIEHKKITIDKYLIWSSSLTLLIIISTFLGWILHFKMFVNGERTYRTYTGWNGHINLNDYDFKNWLLSISAITIGLIVLSHSLRLIKYKMKYIIIQLICLFLYVIAIIGNDQGEIRPGLFIILISAVLLVISYRKKGKKLVLSPYKINC